MVSIVVTTLGKRECIVHSIELTAVCCGVGDTADNKLRSLPLKCYLAVLVGLDIGSANVGNGYEITFFDLIVIASGNENDLFFSRICGILCS